MNRSNMLSIAFCCIFSAVKVQAAWYSPIVGLGRMLATQIVNHKKIALGAGIASALAYLCFTKVREARINSLIECKVRSHAPEIERMFRAGQTGLAARLVRGRTWFKNWQVTISPEVINGMACMEVHGSNGINKRYGFLGDLRENDYGEYKVVNGGHFFLI